MKVSFLIDVIFLLLIFFGFCSLYFNDKIFGDVKSVVYGNNKITIGVDGNDREIILFENVVFDLNVGDKIIAYGSLDLYKGKKQLILDKIVKINFIQNLI